jgi:hypothetical protein
MIPFSQLAQTAFETARITEINWDAIHEFGVDKYRDHMEELREAFPELYRLYKSYERVEPVALGLLSEEGLAELNAQLPTPLDQMILKVEDDMFTALMFLTLYERFLEVEDLVV